ncbi:MAG: helix-turn-helix transcriptional regulator [Colwellia sp.]|nr:helix-turn-helix transcriptional regulator [Colwellia sp.]
MDLAGKLLQLRKLRGWTQAHAAKNIDIQQSYLSKIENGHFTPSPEVMEKFCHAYNTSKEELLSAPDVTNKVGDKGNLTLSLFIGLFFTLAISLLLIAQLALIYPQTYYNYKTIPLSSSHDKKYLLNFHLTDKYLGEQYIQKIDNVNYQFKLVAQREVSRKENRWLTAIGIFFMVLALGFTLFFVRKNNE